MGLFNNWDNVVADVRNELVFEDRHKEYGAYEIRKNHNRNTMLAVIITVSVFVLAAYTPKIIELINGMNEQEVKLPQDITPVDLLAPPPLDETVPPPPPPPPPPVEETVKFTPPVVTNKETPDEPPPPPDDIKKVDTQNQAGTGGDVPPPDVPPDAGPPPADVPLTWVEQMPAFPGGEAAMMKWIKDKISQIGYPQMEKEAGISGTCYVGFVVEKDGSITDVKLMRGVSGGPGYDNVALKVVKAMPPWSAGKQNGREVRVQFNLPIKFTLK